MRDSARCASRILLRVLFLVFLFSCIAPGESLGETGTPPVPSPSKDGTPPAEKPDASLANTYWKLTELNGKAVIPGAGQRELSMILNGEDARVKGFSGCNRFTGEYQMQEGRILFLEMASTRRACADGMEQEQRFLSSLENVVRYEIRGDTLSLFSPNGQLILRFEAVYLK